MWGDAAVLMQLCELDGISCRPQGPVHHGTYAEALTWWESGGGHFWLDRGSAPLYKNAKNVCFIRFMSTSIPGTGHI